MLRPSEVASFLRVSERTVYRWFELGLLDGIRINKSLRITRGSILTLLQRSQRRKIARAATQVFTEADCYPMR